MVGPNPDASDNGVLRSWVSGLLAGDNQLSAWWVVTAEEKLAVALVRVRYVGHALEFSKTVPGMILLLASALALLVVLTKLLQSSQPDSGV